MQCPGEAGRLVWVLCTTALLRPVRNAAPDGGRGRSPDIPQLVTGHDRGMPMAYRGVVTMAIAALVAGGPDGGPKLGTSFERGLPCCVQSHPGPPGTLSGKSQPVFQNSKMAAEDCPSHLPCDSRMQRQVSCSLGEVWLLEIVVHKKIIQCLPGETAQ